MLCSGNPGFRYQGCSGLAPRNAGRRVFLTHRLVDTTWHSRVLCSHSPSQSVAVSAAAKHVTSRTLCMICNVRQPLTNEMES